MATNKKNLNLGTRRIFIVFCVNKELVLKRRLSFG